MASTLRQAADQLERAIERTEREGRRLDREMAFGRLFAHGYVPLPLATVQKIRADLAIEANRAARDGDTLTWRRRKAEAATLDPVLLEQQGWTQDDLRGTPVLRGVAEYPESLPPRPGSAIPDAGGVEAAGGGAGPVSVSVSEARRQVQVARTFAGYQDWLRDREVWDEHQRARAWVLGRVMYPVALRDGRYRQRVLGLLRDHDPEAAERWSDAELRADHTAADLGD